MSETPLRALLRDLVSGLEGDAASDIVVRDLALDSHEVERGTLFLARRGAKHHGLAFVSEALERGAVAVVYDPEGVPPGVVPEAAVPPRLRGSEVLLIPLPRLDAHLGEIARRFYAEATAGLTLTAVTGTNGKTTVAWLLAQAWRLLEPERPTAYLGTVGVGTGEGDLSPLERTTPDVVAMHRWCARLRGRNVARVVCEASSHALVQGRLDGLAIDTAVFTNLSPEHLDYHPSLEDYREAKWRLFERPELRAAVVNVGDETGRLFAARLAAPRPSASGARTLVRFTVGAEEAEFRAENVSARADGTRLDLLGPRGRRRTLDVGLLGRFNVENLLAVAASLHAAGVDGDAIAAILPELGPPPGRLEFVRPPQGPTVVVDFAHTPAALREVLSVCRGLARGRLLVVFGCGGERDRTKRPVMGKLAIEHADRVFLTDDNPRGEDPERITAEILAGMPSEDPRVSVVHDRAEAIARAITEARPEDLVLVAGKGHEETQVYGTEGRPFSDLGVVRSCLGMEGRPC
jgi:UDP-N-acetylmuramoyl-L-alanyl-D-glutamate--2,6-diaminopimelate ligase